MTRKEARKLVGHTIERVATVKVAGLRDARQVCAEAGAKAWDF